MVQPENGDLFHTATDQCRDGSERPAMTPEPLSKGHPDCTEGTSSL
jgi:hypothetical protein